MLAISKIAPDIIAISETKLHKFETCRISLEGYNFEHEGSSTNAGGVGIFIKENISYKICHNYNINLPHCEELWLELVQKKFKCIIGAVYRHPHQNLNRFQKNFQVTLETLNNSNSLYYVGGDFNINLMNCTRKGNKTIKTYVDMIYSLGCIPLITNPTRITETSSSIIDHLYTNNISHKTDSFVILHNLTDHLPILASSYFKTIEKKSNSGYFRDTKEFQVDNFVEDLYKNIASVNLSDALSVNDYFADFISQFSTTLEIHAPMRKFTRKEKKLQTKPWLSKEILTSIRYRNKLYRQCLNEQKPSLWEKYKKYRNKVTRMKEQAKKIHFQNVISKNKQNTAKLWKTINDLLHHKNKKSNRMPQKMCINGIDSEDPKLISNTFNDYFINVGKTLSSKISIVTNCPFTETSLIPNHSQSFFLRPIGVQEVINHINELNTSKSGGSLGIPIKYIKLSVNVIAPILTNFYNHCITTGCFPDILKIAEVIPLYKSGSKNLCSNYHPISILSPFSKIFEKCLHIQLNNYFIQNNILNKNQYGFIKHSSTNDAVVDAYNEFLVNLNKKQVTCAMFLDLSKAFDCLNHNILLKKLEKYGIRGLPLKLFQSYLSNRQQFTIVNGVPSDMMKITCGVPQGSTLGPLLFIIYTNDLPQATKLQVRLFADDTNLTASHHSENLLEKIVNTELQKISNWMKINKLSINYNKTEYIMITTKRRRAKFNLKINNNIINQNTCVKYLGIMIDDSLKWESQIHKMCSKLASGCWALYHLQKYVDCNTLLMVYYSMIHSHLSYCISSWGSASKTTLNPLDILQKRAVRIITHSKSKAHTTPLFHKLQILKLQDLYTLEIAKLMHRLHNNSLNICNLNRDTYKLLDNTHSYHTRRKQSKNYFIPRVKTTQSQNSLTYIGPKVWNEIPLNVKNMKYCKFKNELKRRMISDYNM